MAAANVPATEAAASVQAPARPRTLSAAEMQREAEAWFERQVARLQRIHGPAWHHTGEWVQDYLRAQLRMRLLELGWRPLPR